MLQFIVTDILMFSVGAIFYLMVRALPRIAEEPSERKNFLYRLAHSDIPEKIDMVLDGFLLKLLRKIKIIVLKLDNALSKELRRMKPKGNEANPAIDFKEIIEQKKEENRTEE